MRKYAVIEKEVGKTPLEALRAFTAAHPAYEKLPASYAGRLDPMASGKLIILLGEECKKQTKYTGLDKEYEVEVLFDLGSDTGDALGIVTPSSRETRPTESILHQALSKEIGAHERAYPKFSSKTVDGKPLFLHALQGTLADADIPKHEERIYGIKLLNVEKISSAALRARIESFLARAPVSDEPSKALGADFRIKDVRASWDAAFGTSRNYLIIRIKVVCASGTYMRSLASRIGQSLGTSALALSIYRTKIGKYWRGLWLKQM